MTQKWMAQKKKAHHGVPFYRHSLVSVAVGRAIFTMVVAFFA